MKGATWCGGRSRSEREVRVAEVNLSGSRALEEGERYIYMHH